MPVAAIAPTRTRRKRGTINREMILDISATLFQEKGYDRTTLDDVAAALSITKPSLYYHFANKEEILVECVRSAFDKFQEKIAERDDPSAPGRRRVETFLRLYLEVISNDIGVSMVLADDRVMSEEGRRIYNGFRRTLNKALEDRIIIGVEDGSLDVPETRLTTYSLFGMFNWVGHWNFRRHKISVDEIFDRFMSVAMNGIAAR